MANSNICSHRTSLPWDRNLKKIDKANSRPAWTRSCAACCRWPCFSRRVGLDDPQRSLPTPTILWFCGHSLHRQSVIEELASQKRLNVSALLVEAFQNANSDSCSMKSCLYAAEINSTIELVKEGCCFALLCIQATLHAEMPLHRGLCIRRCRPPVITDACLWAF